MSPLNRYTRKALKICLWLLGIIVIIWTGLYIYLAVNKNKLREKIVTEIQKRSRGEVQVGSVSPELFGTFPFISLELSDVIIRDSLWNQHKQDFVNLRHIYLRVSPISLLSKKRIGRIILRSGSINLFTDESGYTNGYIMQGDQDKVQEEEKEVQSFPDLAMQNIQFRLQDKRKNKLHDIKIQKLVCAVSDLGDHLSLDFDTRLFIGGLGFNLKKGSYMKQKPLRGSFELRFNKENKRLSFSGIDLKLDQNTYRFTGYFTLDSRDADYMLSIVGKNVSFSNSVGLLPDSVRSKTSVYSFDKPVSFTVDVAGKTYFRFKPIVNVHLNVEKNSLNTPFGTFTNSSFKSSFSNNVDPTMPREDPNSMLLVEDFSGSWNNILLKSDSIKITHLKRPYLECKILTDFDLKELNELTRSNTLQFTGGHTFVDLSFKGPIGGTDSTESAMNGIITLENAGFTYIPRDIRFSEGNGAIHFRGKDVAVNKLNVKTGKTQLTMNGGAKNFLSLLDISPEQLNLVWNIRSPHLYLSDYKGFLSSPAQAKPKRSEPAPFGRTAANIDRMFVDGNVQLTLESPKIEYKRFDATDLEARVQMKPAQISLEEVSFKHAKGSVMMSGTMTDNGNRNALKIKTRINRLDIPTLFYAFNDFGQDAVTNKNLKGRLTADIDLSTTLSNQASLVAADSRGKIDFLLENGELNKFEPIQAVGEKVFKKQDFSTIQFADLETSIGINGTAFEIDQMEIRSTALKLFVKGVYDVVKGTDMSIIVPVRNLLKSNKNIDLTDEGKKSKGVSVRLRAKTGDDGKLKLSWDPFGRAASKAEDVKK